ncbi:hypothetical protein AAG906_020717 [Vitis piasezkii]
MPPPPLPPLNQTAPQALPYLLHDQSKFVPPVVVHTIQHIRQLRVSDSSAVWDDLDSIPVASLSAKFRMFDIERYTDIGCPCIHL